MRTKNFTNDGRALENLFLQTCEQYKYVNLLRLHKVEPPVRVLGWGGARKVIFLENPFSDTIGTWTERAGRMLMFELKSTKEPRLQIGGSGGVNEKQLEWLRRWAVAGAAVGVIWEYVGHGWVFIPIGQPLEVIKSGRKHLKFQECDTIKQGMGKIVIDFLPNLRRWYSDGPLPPVLPVASKENDLFDIDSHFHILPRL